jgi:hypothetical protein
MLRIILLLLTCATANFAVAQVNILNGTFDGVGCSLPPPGCKISGWYNCLDGGWAVGSPTNPSQGIPYSPFSDSTFIVMWEEINITQKLSCTLKKNRAYTFYIAVSSYLIPPVSPQAILGIYASSDSCSLTELLYRSEHLEYEWSYRKVLVTPANDDYSFIVVRADDDTSQYFSRLFVDALSDLHKHNGNAVHIQNVTDTTIQPGACVQLQATADITTYNTVFWLKKYQVQDGFRIDTIRSTFTLNDCPISTTTYIIALRDSVPDCAGYWWSYDTVKVTVNTGTGVAPLSHAEGLGLRLFPNPATNTLTIKTSQLSPLTPQLTFAIHNTIGQALQSGSINDTQMTIDISLLPKGVYIFTLLKNNKILQYEKLVKQ